MESFKDNVKRIEWLDIFRGILIILMVIGHSTGLFNKYIYQFHMAAFFFLSGYTFHPEKKSFFRTVFDKFFTVLLPTVATILFGLIILWLLHLGNWDVLFSTWQFPGWEKALVSLFTYGDIYVDVLGANWFLITLFGVCMLSKLIHLLVGRSLLGYLSISALLYGVGYGIVKMGCVPPPHIGMFAIDLILIGNLFYALGYWFRESGIFNWIASRSTVRAFCLVTAAICTLIIAHYLHVIADWPSHRFSGPILNGWSALNGIVLVFTLSLYVEHFSKWIGKLLSYIGKNTLGILFFHFSFFKIMYLPFYWSGIIAIDDLSCITPGRMSTSVLEKKCWFIVVIGALILSLALWKLLLHSKILSFLLGQNKQAYIGIWNALVNTKLASGLIYIRYILVRKIKEVRLRFFETYKWNRLLWLSAALMLVLVAVPLYKQAIICNDELQTRLWSMKGFSQFYEHFFREEIGKGRALRSVLIPLTMFLGFLGSSNWSFKILQIISILLVALLFAIFLDKVFRNKRFAMVCGLSTLAFMPITFEHMAPNAFVTFYNVPFCMLLLSLILFIGYIQGKGKSYLIWSMVLLFINLLSYESFVMLLPLYWGLIVWEKGIHDKKQLLRKSLYPTMVAALFLMCYAVFSAVFPSHYSGNQIGGFTLKSSLDIVLQLLSASFPGYFLWTPKYRYLFTYYYNLKPENHLRILLVCIVFGCILYYMGKGEKKMPARASKFWCPLGMGILCIILPTCPIAVAEMYQGNVGANTFIALPITFFTYLAATFVCWFVIWQLIQKFHNKRILLFLTVGIACYLLPVQAMNDVIAEQQNSDFHRLTTMERFFSTDLMELFEGREIKSDDYFVTHNALAIHNPYWTEFANYKGKDIQIINAQGELEDICLYFDGTQFTIRAGKEICIITTKPQTGYGICQYAEEEYAIASFENPLIDNGLYEYFYKLSDTGELTAGDKESFALGLVGNNLQSSFKDYGYYADGWVAKSSQFQIRSGETGAIDIDVYYPADDFYGKEIQLYVDDVLTDTIEIHETFQTIHVDTEPDHVTRIKLETNFLQENTGTDTRELSMIILSMQGY